MNTTRRAFLGSTVAASAGMIITGCSAGGRRAGAEEDGFVSLFDGRTLDGWHTNRQRVGHGTGGRWAIEDGAITGEQDPPGSGNGGILLTDQKFADFELLLEMNHDWGPDSGLFLRSTERGQCFQMMVDYHDRGNIGHIYGEGTTGFNTRTFDINGIVEDDRLVRLTTDNHRTVEQAGLVDSCTPQQWLDAWKIGSWNTVRVRCVGQYPRITTWINGLKVCEFDGETSTAERYDKQRIAQILGREGHIALQVHGGTGAWPAGKKCRWRNIRIKSL